MKRYNCKDVNHYVPVIILHQIEKIMTLIDSDIELSKEHQPAGKATPQSDKDSASVSSSDFFRVPQIWFAHWEGWRYEGYAL